MNTHTENNDLTLAAKPVKKDKPQPKGQGKDHTSEKPKPKPKLHALHPYAGTVGEYGANPSGIYDRFVLTTADGQAHQVKFPPHFGAALHAAAQPGQAATVLGYLHTTPKGDEHLHLAQVTAAGQQLRPIPPKGTETTDLRGEIAEVLRDPKGHPRALRLAGEATELRFPPHLDLGSELTALLVVGAAVQASGALPADRPGELRVPGTQAPLQVAFLSVGNQAYAIH